MEDIIEISCETDTEFKERGVCVGYENGKEVYSARTFDEAMRWAFPDHIPHTDYMSRYFE